MAALLGAGAGDLQPLESRATLTSQAMRQESGETCSFGQVTLLAASSKVGELHRWRGERHSRHWRHLAASRPNVSTNERRGYIYTLLDWTCAKHSDAAASTGLV
jgi:hypothetical protein